MKKISMLAIAGTLAMSAIFFGCQKDAQNTGNDVLNIAGRKAGTPVEGSNCSGYNVVLTRSYENGKTTFIWAITNPNPGNGNNGTIQNLSHWNFIPGCAGPEGLEANWEDIDEAAYKSGEGIWNPIFPVPELQPDPSQNCSNANVFKFNQGTSGGVTTYYKLVLWGNYSTAQNTAVFKSGANTGCCIRTVDGIGCKVIDDCSLSQGYYFAKPGPTWGGQTVIVGGQEYTEAEGRAIWGCSNAGGIRDSKKGFTQVAALKLSGAYPTSNVSINADVVIVEAWLATLGKLDCTNLPTGNAAVGSAAGRIGDWINANHCED